MITKRDIVKYYIAMFDRIPEKDAVDIWYNEAINNNWSEQNLVDSLFNAAVSIVNSNDSLKTLYPQYVNFNIENVDSVKGIIESVYKALFDKSYEDDKEGIMSWTMKIVNKELSLPTAIVSIENFAEDVYNGKINLEKLGYSKEEINKIYEAVNAFESRIQFAEKVSNILENININNDVLEVLKEDINIIHSENDFSKACEYLEENLDKIVINNIDEGVIIEKLNELCGDDSSNVEDLLENGENLGFIDLPAYTNEDVDVIIDSHYTL